MRILLVATNQHHRLMSRMDARPLPIGLAYVAGHLDPDRHTLKVLDLMFSTDYRADVQDAVREFQPDLIGISLRNLDNHSYLDPQWALPITKEVIECIRAITSSPIVCGGPAFSILPRECFRFLEPDLGIAGDGGETFAQLADLIEVGELYHSLPGLVYREGEEIIVQGGPASSAFPKPPRLEELDMARYERAGFGIGILTKLGDFYYPTTAGRKETDGAAWRVIRPIEEVVEEAREMKHRFGLRKVFFIDSGFNVPLAHAKALCQSLIESGLKLRWNTCLAPIPQSCDSEGIGLMKSAGCSLAIMTGIGGHDDEQVGIDDQLGPLQEVSGMCEEGGAALHHLPVFRGAGRDPGDGGEEADILEGAASGYAEPAGGHPSPARLASSPGCTEEGVDRRRGRPDSPDLLCRGDGQGVDS